MLLEPMTDIEDEKMASRASKRLMGLFLVANSTAGRLCRSESDADHDINPEESKERVVSLCLNFVTQGKRGPRGKEIGCGELCETGR